MRFFPALKRSLTSPQFYWQVLNLPLRSSVFFWIKSYLLLLIGAIAVVIISAFAVRGLIQQYYPQDLTFSYSYVDKTLESSQQLPIVMHALGYTLALSDTTFTFDSQHDENYTSTYNELLGEFPSFTVNKETALQVAPSLLPLFGVTLAVTTVAFLMLMRFPLLMLYALVIQSVLSLFSRKIPYSAILQMSLHAGVIAEILNIAYMVFYRTRTFPMYDVAFFGIMILVFRSRRVQIVQTG